jgi:hypothetical protein
MIRSYHFLMVEKRALLFENLLDNTAHIRCKAKTQLPYPSIGGLPVSLMIIIIHIGNRSKFL